jgi:hypothetical protein
MGPLAFHNKKYRLVESVLSMLTSGSALCGIFLLVVTFTAPASAGVVAMYALALAHLAIALACLAVRRTLRP